MTQGLFAHHSLLTTDYPGAPPAPPAPPAPAPAVQPPASAPIAFSAVVRETLYGERTVAISSTTMATVTCADASMTVRASPAVPGLTWAYSAGALTVSGTPTQQGQWRVVVTFIASDGSNAARGSTEHEVTIEDFGVAFTVGTCANPVVRIGETVDVTLCSPTTAKYVDVFAVPNQRIPVVPTPPAVSASGIVLTWTPGATSSGTLKLQGTIADTAPLGATVLTVEYRRKGNQQTLFATSQHTITVQPRYEAPTPAPAPSPAPPAPAPSPPPAPTPAPAPFIGPDSLFASVKVLMHFNAATGIAADVKGNTFTNYGATLVPGVVGDAASFTGADTYISGTVPGLAGADGELCIEAMVQLDAQCVAELLEPAALGRFGFCPVATLLGADGRPVWMLGFLSSVVGQGGVLVKSYAPVFLPRGPNIPNNQPFGQYIIAGYPEQTAAPGRFVHIAGLMRVNALNAAQFNMTSWSDFRYRGQIGVGEVNQLTAAPSATLRIGGGVPGGGPDLIRNTTFVPFRGLIDELRGTANRRYTAVFNGDPGFAVPTTLAVPAPKLPWPNY